MPEYINPYPEGRLAPLRVLIDVLQKKKQKSEENAIQEKKQKQKQQAAELKQQTAIDKQRKVDNANEMISQNIGTVLSGESGLFEDIVPTPIDTKINTGFETPYKSMPSFNTDATIAPEPEFKRQLSIQNNIPLSAAELGQIASNPDVANASAYHRGLLKSTVGSALSKISEAQKYELKQQRENEDLQAKQDKLRSFTQLVNTPNIPYQQIQEQYNNLRAEHGTLADQVFKHYVDVNTKKNYKIVPGKMPGYADLQVTQTTPDGVSKTDIQRSFKQTSHGSTYFSAKAAKTMQNIANDAIKAKNIAKFGAMQKAKLGSDFKDQDKLDMAVKEANQKTYNATQMLLNTMSAKARKYYDTIYNESNGKIDPEIFKSEIDNLAISSIKKDSGYDPADVQALYMLESLMFDTPNRGLKPQDIDAIIKESENEDEQ